MAESKYKFDDPKAAFAEAEKRILKALETGAKELNLVGLGLTGLPESIGQLTELQELRLGGNRLETLPGSLGHLTQLRSLSLQHNLLTELPDWVGRLTNLQELYSHSNRLITLPMSIGRLTQLRKLWIQKNELANLPDSLHRLSALEELYLHRNGSLRLPKEILGPSAGDLYHLERAKPADILDYYFRVRIGKRPLNEAKLILLGRGEVGKTCVVNRLVHDKFASTSMTRGIVITQWQLEIGNNARWSKPVQQILGHVVVSGGDTVRLHVWDFGGQEIQHATHQFFLTERSLYLVVLNGRAGAEDEDAE